MIKIDIDFCVCWVMFCFVVCAVGFDVLSVMVDMVVDDPCFVVDYQMFV